MDYSQYSILVVDDTPLNLSLIVDYLTEYGFRIRVARSGEMALKGVAYAPPSLILLDVVMPGIDGFETCRQLKLDPASQHIPVIFMTALAKPADKVRAFEAGAVDYVTKPLVQEEVLARIVTHLRLHDLTQSLQEENQQIEARSYVEKKRLLEAVDQQRRQLHRLNTMLTQIQEEERKQLARELHDEMGQALTAISINLAATDKNLPPDTPDFVRERLTEAIDLTDQTLEQIREISLNLRPPMLDDLGLFPTLRWYINRFAQRLGIEAVLDASTLQDRLPPLIETTIYRALQEALTNVARHAKADQVTVRLRRAQACIMVDVTDNGCGFNLHTVDVAGGSSTGLGLLGMQERIGLLGGAFTVESTPDVGTQIHFEIPC